MLETEVTIKNQLGLHARAAAQLVKLAGKFESDIKLIKEEDSIFADAKSILSILTLAASKGTKLLIKAEGKDENKALEAIKELFEGGFGEF